MKSTTNVQLAVFLLNERHEIKGAGRSVGQPRYAVRRIMEQAVDLVSFNPSINQHRLVIIPLAEDASVDMATATKQAQFMSRTGQIVPPPMGPEEITLVGKRAAMTAWFGQLAESVRLSRAKVVDGSRLDQSSSAVALRRYKAGGAFLDV